MGYKIKQEKNGIARQSGASLIVNGLGAIFALLATVAIGRQLGSAESGYFFWFLSLAVFVSSVGQLGLNQAIVRFSGIAVSEDDQFSVRLILFRSLLSVILFGTFLSLVLFFIAPWLANDVLGKPELTSVIRMGSPAVLFVALYALCAASLQGQRRPFLSIFVLSISVNILMISGVLILGIDKANVAAGMFSFAAIVTFVLGIILSFKKKAISAATKRVISWKVLFKSSLPLWIVAMMAQATLWSGQIIAGTWLDTEKLAQLAVAQRCALVLTLILAAVNIVIAPHFASLYKQGKIKHLEILAIRSVRLMIFIATPLLIIFVVFPERVMALFGDGFVEGGKLLRILAIGQFINVATGSVGWLLSMSGHERDLRNMVLVTGPLAIGLALVLTPIFGATGSALSTTVAISIQTFLAVFIVRYRLGFNALAIWRF